MNITRTCTLTSATSSEYPLHSTLPVLLPGSTSELSVVVDWVREHYPLSPLLAAGFSMGANILTKYLAEKPERQSWFIGALSCSQGYRADA